MVTMITMITGAIAAQLVFGTTDARGETAYSITRIDREDRRNLPSDPVELAVPLDSLRSVLGH